MPVTSLFDIIKRDAKFIVNKGGYQVDIQMTTKSGDKTVNITGWAVKIGYSFDTDANQVREKNVHITIDEDALKAQNYPYINNTKKIKEIDLQGHFVSFKDSSGEVKDYQVKFIIPDENLGLITAQLEDYRKY